MKQNYQKQMDAVVASLPQGERPRLLLQSCCVYLILLEQHILILKMVIFLVSYVRICMEVGVTMIFQILDSNLISLFKRMFIT